MNCMTSRNSGQIRFDHGAFISHSTTQVTEIHAILPQFSVLPHNYSFTRIFRYSLTEFLPRHPESSARAHRRSRNQVRNFVSSSTNRLSFTRTSRQLTYYYRRFHGPHPSGCCKVSAVKESDNNFCS